MQAFAACSIESGATGAQRSPNHLRSGLEKTRKFLLKARKAATAIQELLLASGPGRVRFRVDVEAQGVARLAPGGASGELGSVGHDHFDCMVLGMSVGLHSMQFLSSLGGRRR